MIRQVPLYAQDVLVSWTTVSISRIILRYSFPWRIFVLIKNSMQPIGLLFSLK